jgi:hypothetical protein
METLKQRILELITKQPGLTDREITDVLEGPGRPQQPVNQACRGLERSGNLTRHRRSDGLIGNFVSEGQAFQVPLPRPQPLGPDSLSEDFVKRAVGDWLRGQGWEVKIAWGGERGVDILAQRSTDRWIIEAKGHGDYPQKQGNYFLNGLSELLQRMDDPVARYSLAFPDIPRYKGLWERLPKLVKELLNLSMLFVDENGTVRVA